MPVLETRGALSAQNYGLIGQQQNYIEDVFSTYLYTGNSTTGGTQTITNGVDLSTKGGMVWIKGRNAASNNVLFDTARGAGTTASNNQALSSNLVNAEDLAASYDFLSAFNATGFTVTQGGTTTATRGANYNSVTYASWAFRKQPKFFDVVTYTGDGVAGRTVPHNLGSVPGCIIVKCLTPSGIAWQVYHRSLGNNQYLVLNTTAAAGTSAFRWNNTTPTASVFTLGSLVEVNGSGYPYVAYLFAHDAGGFGATGTDNVISCGSYTGDGFSPGPTITLGYEPQWILIKRTDSTSNWSMFDNMRGMTVGAGDTVLYPNLSNAEGAPAEWLNPSATGFRITTSDTALNANGGTYIYIAIRRGPMKTPTTGTSVFGPSTYIGGSTTTISFPPDLVIQKARNTLNPGTDAEAPTWVDRLRGAPTSFIPTLFSNQTAAETTGFDLVGGFYTKQNQYISYAGSSYNEIGWAFRRAPGFFDVVCYTGTGANRTVSHNLGVAPELMIVKARNNTIGYSWFVYSSALGASKVLNLNQTLAEANNSAAWNDTAPTSALFSLGTSASINKSGDTYVAYLFATVAGVSKVGSYTGTGTTNQINCGFTGGARFVLIKRTDSTGDWYVWDSARGIVAGNDPYLLLNSAAAEVTSTDYVDTYSAGFEISSTAPAAINANGGSFIFLAIA